MKHSQFVNQLTSTITILLPDNDFNIHTIIFQFKFYTVKLYKL